MHMITEQWNEYGYSVVIDNGFVYLVRAQLEVGYVTPEDHDTWTLHPNVNRPPWRFVSFRNHPRILALARAQIMKECA